MGMNEKKNTIKQLMSSNIISRNHPPNLRNQKIHPARVLGPLLDQWHPVIPGAPGDLRDMGKGESGAVSGCPLLRMKADQVLWSMTPGTLM